LLAERIGHLRLPYVDADARNGWQRSPAATRPDVELALVWAFLGTRAFVLGQAAVAVAAGSLSRSDNPLLDAALLGVVAVGRAYPPGRRQIVGAVFHLADREPCRRLNDVVCVGEVRAPSDPGQLEPDLVIDVAELIWEPIAD